MINKVLVELLNILTFFPHKVHLKHLDINKPYFLKASFVSIKFDVIKWTKHVNIKSLVLQMRLNKVVFLEIFER